MTISTRGLKSNSRLKKALIPGGALFQLTELARNNPKEYFLGIRDNSVNLYFMGGSLLKVGSRATTFSFNNNYHADSKDERSYESLEEWLKDLPTLKSAVKEFQLNNFKKKMEKIAQQEILANTNSNINTDYYIVDMEYSVSGLGYGRFDYIGISKRPEADGKYHIALIELKYGLKAFSTTSKHKTYGSGIVGHTLNFNEFIYGEGCQFNPLAHLRNEIVNILNNYKELGLSNGPLFEDITEDKISIDKDTIQTLFLCVGCENIAKTRDTAKKYLGIHPKKNAKYTIKDKVINPHLKLRWCITDQSSVPGLLQSDFQEIS